MSKPFFKTFIGNLLIVIALCVAMYWLFFSSLSIITRHDDVKTVPSLEGKNLESAIQILKSQGYDYQIDSIYNENKKPHEIIDQVPEKGAVVKGGRTIYLVVNTKNKPLVALPNFVGMSYRTIMLVLKRKNLALGDTSMVYDISENVILKQMINGKAANSGIKVPMGTKIDFVISAGLSDEQVWVPDLLGKSYFEAKEILEKKGIQMSAVFEGKITDSTTAKIYQQLPDYKNEYGEPLKLFKGEILDIRIQQNPTIPKRTYIKRPVEEYVDNSNFDNLHNTDQIDNNQESGDNQVEEQVEQPEKVTPKEKTEAPPKKKPRILGPPPMDDGKQTEKETSKTRPNR